MNEIKTHCAALAKQGYYGHELHAKMMQHFSKPSTLMCMIMDGDPIAKHLLAVMREAIRNDITAEVIAANDKALH